MISTSPSSQGTHRCSTDGEGRSKQPLLSLFDGPRALDDQAMLPQGHALFQNQFAIGLGLQASEMVNESDRIRDDLVQTCGLLLALRRGRRPICCPRRQIQADDTLRERGGRVRVQTPQKSWTSSNELNQGPFAGSSFPTGLPRAEKSPCPAQ